MVRPNSIVWNHYIIEFSHGKKTAKCKYCPKKYTTPNATKMAKHLQKCLKTSITLTVPVKPNLENEPYDVLAESQSLVIPDTENMHVDQNLTESIFPDLISKEESEELDAAFAKAIYSLNVPLSLAEGSYWEEFFKKIRPSYKVPSHHDLTNRLLDKEYEDITQFVQEQINMADDVTIITHGWSNIHNEGVVNYVVTTPTPLFFKSVETQKNHCTSEYISHELMKVIKEVGDQKVLALVTDNASNMKGAWKIIQEQYPQIFIVGCGMHGLNLLLDEISKIETFQVIILRAKEVIKYFKNEQAVLSAFTSKQKRKKKSVASTLKLPSDTKWCSTLIMFESLLNNKKPLQETVNIEELNIDKEIKMLVLNNDIFWASIESLVNILSSIYNGISIIESDNATLSDVPHIFFSIKKSLMSVTPTPLQREEEKAIKNMVEISRAAFCQPIHYAAYVLDPRYTENDLDVDDFKSAIDFITNFPVDKPAANILADYAHYKSRQSVYENDAVWEYAKLMSPFIWWKGFFKDQCLSSVALRIFSIPPSSTSCESIFSKFSEPHTSVSDQLNNERLSKLVAVGYNLILKSKQSSDLIDEDI